MDMLKKYFPFSFKAKDVKDLVINIVIYLVVSIVGGWVLGLIGAIPVIGLIADLVTAYQRAAFLEGIHIGFHLNEALQGIGTPR